MTMQVIYTLPGDKVWLTVNYTSLESVCNMYMYSYSIQLRYNSPIHNVTIEKLLKKIFILNMT